jgi:Spy/CpxP family protein refolding chaperone
VAGTGGKLSVTDRPRALAVLVAVLLVGCIAGAAGSYYYLKQDVETRRSRREEGPPFPQGRQRLPELLQLTPEQDARFREIMMGSRKQLEALRAEQIPKIDAIRAETNRQFSDILNPEQQKKFEAFLREWETIRRHPPRNRDFEPPPR